MAIDEKTREALAAALLTMDPERLGALRDGLVGVRTDLEDLNSAFPATREFLERKGLTNVRDLDEAGMTELVDHLTALKESLERNFN